MCARRGHRVHGAGDRPRPRLRLRRLTATDIPSEGHHFCGPLARVEVRGGRTRNNALKTGRRRRVRELRVVSSVEGPATPVQLRLRFARTATDARTETSRSHRRSCTGGCDSADLEADHNPGCTIVPASRRSSPPATTSTDRCPRRHKRCRCFNPVEAAPSRTLCRYEGDLVSKRSSARWSAAAAGVMPCSSAVAKTRSTVSVDGLDCFHARSRWYPLGCSSSAMLIHPARVDDVVRRVQHPGRGEPLAVRVSGELVVGRAAHGRARNSGMVCSLMVAPSAQGLRMSHSTRWMVSGSPCSPRARGPCRHGVAPHIGQRQPAADLREMSARALPTLPMPAIATWRPSSVARPHKTARPPRRGRGTRPTPVPATGHPSRRVNSLTPVTYGVTVRIRSMSACVVPTSSAVR